MERKYGYHDICDGQACCQNCDKVIDFEDEAYKGIVFYYCKEQDGYVDKSGACGKYSGFFSKKEPEQIRRVDNIEIIVGNRGYD
jgi:hypothetical protein